MIMDMLTVCMGRHDKCVFSFCKRHRKLIPNPVRRFRVHFVRLETLPDMIGDYFIFPLTSPRKIFIFALCEYKLLVGYAAVADVR